MHWRNRHSGPRRGSFLIEAVVAVALLTTALVAVGRLAQASAALEHQADQQLAATLAGDAVVQRMRTLPTDQWQTQAATQAREVAALTGCEIEATVVPMASPNGFHLQISVQLDQQVKRVFHDWRLTPAPSDPIESKTDQPAESDESQETEAIE